MNIKLFTTNNGYYAYDANTNEIFRMPKYIFTYLGKRDKLNRNLTNSESRAELWIAEMQNSCEAFLPLKNIPIEYPYKKYQIEYLLKNRINGITLELTRECNLRCKYCFLSSVYDYTPEYENVSMSYSDIDAAISMLLLNSKDSQRLTISFYGGEPLLEYEKIKYVVNKMNDDVIGKEVVYSLTTNALLLTKEMITFFAENNFSLAVSLDGPACFHDENRIDINGNSTHSRIMQKLELIKTLNADFYNERMSFVCVAPGIVGVSEICSFFEKLGTTFSITDIAPGSDFNLEMYKEKFESTHNDNDINVLGSKYFEKLVSGGWLDNKDVLKCLFDLGYASVLGTSKFSYSHIRTFWPSGPCSLCIKKCFIDIRGNIYPCEKVNYNNDIFILGNVQTGINLTKYNKLVELYTKKSEKCINCWARLICNQCWVNLDKHADNCDETLKQCEWTLQSSMEILEKNPSAIDYFSTMFGGNG